MGALLAKWIYPHHHNDNQPYAIRHQGLFLFVILIAATQIFANTMAGDSKVLGYATDITRAAIIQLTNNERVSNGLGALEENTSLSQAAALKANDMFTDDYWAHFSPDGTSPWYFFDQVGYGYTWAGENLAKDFETSGGVVAGWMASTAGHRENILSSNFTEIGVGVKNGILLGEETTLVVQFFGKPVSYTASAPPSQPVSGTGATVEDKLQLGSGEPTKTTLQETVGGVESVDQGTSGVLENINSFSIIENLSNSQRTSFGLLFVLGSLFAVDSLAIYRKKHRRLNSHSGLHASVVIILMLVLAVQSFGSIA